RIPTWVSGRMRLSLPAVAESLGGSPDPILGRISFDTTIRLSTLANSPSPRERIEGTDSDNGLVAVLPGPAPAHRGSRSRRDQPDQTGSIACLARRRVSFPPAPLVIPVCHRTRMIPDSALS